MADGSIKFDIELEDTVASDSVKQLRKEVNELEHELSKTDSKKMTNLADSMEENNNAINQGVEKLKTYQEQLQRLNYDLNDFKLEGDNIFEGEQFTEGQKLQQQIDLIREKQAQVKTELKEQNEIQNVQILSADKYFQKTEDIRKSIERVDTKNIADNTAKAVVETKKLDNSVKSVANSTDRIPKSLNKGVKSITRTALALFSIRSIYGAISRLGRQAINSTEEWAVSARGVFSTFSQGLSNALAPVIKSISSMLLTLMGYINAITQAFFGITLFSGKTDKNIGSSVGGAKKLNKELKKINASFDTAEVISSQLDDNLGGAGGGGVSTVPPIEIPTPDFTPIKKAIDSVIKMLDPFIKTIKSIDFKPMIKSLENLGNAFVGLGKVVGKSIINIMNDSLGPFIKLMMEDIRPRMFDSFADAILTLTPHIEWFMTSFVEPFIEFMLTEFTPVFLFMLIEGFDLLIAILDPFIEGFLIALETIRPFAEFIGNVLLIVMGTLAVAFQWLTEEIGKEDSALANLIKVIGFLVGIFTVVKGTMLIVGGVIAALTKVGLILTNMFGGVLAVIKVVAGFFAGAFTGAILPIIVLVALLGTMLIGLIDNFEQVKQDFMRIVGNIKGIFTGLIDFIAGIFTGDWGRAWEGVKSIFKNIIDGIANIFKFPINLIIDGINVFLRGLNRIKIPNWVPVVGGKGFNIGQIPRLAKGGVLRQPTLNLAGEYAGARTNPEIVTPQKLLDERIAKGLANLENIQGNNQPIIIKTIIEMEGKQIAEVVNEYNDQKSFNMNGGLVWNT